MAAKQNKYNKKTYKTLTVRFSSKYPSDIRVLEALKEYAVFHGDSVNAIVIAALREFLFDRL